MNGPIYRDDHVIAWITNPCNGDNERCTQAHAEGRRIHIIPMHTDPRAAEVQLWLPTYHYTSEAEAVAALDSGWETELVVDNAIDRDKAYALGAPVKLRKDGAWA